MTVYSARDSNFFSNRVINIWNALPNSIVNLRPSTALNPKLIAFISVIFVLIVLFGYIFNLFSRRGHVSYRLLPLGPGCLPSAIVLFRSLPHVFGTVYRRTSRLHPRCLFFAVVWRRTSSDAAFRDSIFFFFVVPVKLIVHFTYLLTLLALPC